MRDLRHAIRTLLKNPGFAIMAILMLALGIGACTAIFTVVNSVLLRPLPYPEPDRIVQLFELSDKGTRMNLPEANFVDWKEGSRNFEYMALVRGNLAPVIGGNETVRARVATVSEGFFGAMGAKPVMGTLPADNEPTVIVSHGFWQRVLGSDPNFQARSLTIYGEVHSIVGVMPEGFAFPTGTEVWTSRAVAGKFIPSRSAHNWGVIGRLRPGVSIEAVRSELDAIAKRLHDSYRDVTAVGATVVPLKEQLTQNVRVALPVLFGAVGILLLIACANVGNLLLTHSAGRQRELAIRAALGAGRAALVRLFLAQSLVLTTIGAALGIALAVSGVDALLALGSTNLPRVDEIRVDGFVLAFSLAVSLAVGTILGIVPALRIAAGNLDDIMKEGGRSNSSGRSHRRMRAALIISQVALTVILLIGAGLLGRSFVRALSVNLGFETQNRLSVDLLLPPGSDNNRGRDAAFHQQLLDRISAIPGVRAAGGTSAMPLSGRNSNGRFQIGGGRDSGAYWPGYRIATPGYFAAMGIPLIRGRVFDQTDGATTPEVAVISKAVADTVWPGEDAIGKQINYANMDGDEKFMTIVGIVGDVRQLGPESPVTGDIYVHYLQRGSLGGFTIVMDSTNSKETLIPTLTAYIKELNPQASARFQTVEQTFSSVLANRRFNLLIIGVFGATALILALMGVYGVTAYSVAQRTQEIGIRMALGAQSGDVVRLFVVDGSKLVFIGIALGVFGAFASGRVLASLLFEVQPTDIPTYLLTIIPLLGASLLASHLPARRASRVDPMITMRT